LERRYVIAGAGNGLKGRWGRGEKHLSGFFCRMTTLAKEGEVQSGKFRERRREEKTNAHESEKSFETGKSKKRCFVTTNSPSSSSGGQWEVAGGIHRVDVGRQPSESKKRGGTGLD